MVNAIRVALKINDKTKAYRGHHADARRALNNSTTEADTLSLGNHCHSLLNWDDPS
jgi:hypothetical protein